MSARCALAFVAASSILSLGCGASGGTEVSITDLIMKVEPDGTVRSGTFNLHVARQASASGSSGIRLHEMEIGFDGDDWNLIHHVARLRGEAPGDLDPGASIVIPMGFDLDDERAEETVTGQPFNSCEMPSGFFLRATYLDEASAAFFTVRSSPSWIPPKVLSGTTWARTFGDAGPDRVYGAAAFADGSSALVGATSDAAAPFVMKLDAAGNTVWDRRMALSSSFESLGVNQGPSLVAESSSGGIVIAGAFDGTLDLGGGEITSAGDTDVFFARLDATGKVTETRRFGDGLAQTVSAMDVDTAGNVVLVGTLAGAMDFGAGAVAPIIDPNVRSYYVARLPEAGAPIYAKVPLALQQPVQFAAAVGAEGSVVLGGSFFGGNAWIGAEPPHSKLNETGFLVTLAPDGSIAWSAVIDDAVVTQVALDQGDVVAVVSISGDKVVLGGKQVSSGPEEKTFVLARFDPAGALRYAIPSTSENGIGVTRLAIDSAGHSLLSGHAFAPFSLANTTIISDKRPSAFFAELDRSGAHVRSMAFGCPNEPVDLAVAHTGSRDILLASSFFGAVDLGKGMILSAGATDLLVTKLPAQ